MTRARHLSRFDAILTAIAAVDAASATATFDADRVRIMAQIEGSCGFAALNSSVKEAARVALLATARAALRDEETTASSGSSSDGADAAERALVLLESTARLAADLDQHADAESLFSRAADGRRALHGAEAAPTLSVRTRRRVRPS